MREVAATVKDTRRLRIGIPTEYNVAELAPSVRKAWKKTVDALTRHGHSLHPVSLPATRHALSAYYVLAPAEASSNLAKYDGVRYGNRKTADSSEDGVESENAKPHTLYANTRAAGFGDEVQRRILLGSYSLSADAIDNYFIQAQRVRRLVQRDFDRVFRQPNVLMESSAAAESSSESNAEEGVDLLICPTAPTPPPTLDSLRAVEPVRAYMNDVFTVPASLAGLPAVSVPVSLGSQSSGQNKSNVGMQVICQFGFDDLALDVAELIETSNQESS
jgi:aspartyl-tRNA(Asn)/glutamyl-tRNA(Gln) amidotransferase subunit A